MLTRFFLIFFALTSFVHAGTNHLSLKTEQDWTDEDLKTLVMSGKKGIIYSWSPKFAYSVLEMPRFEKLAKRLGYEFTAVVDPRVHPDEVVAALDMMSKKNLLEQKANLSGTDYYRNVSNDVVSRTDLAHFPVMLVYNNKKIHTRNITGLMTNHEFQVAAQAFSKDLK